MSIVYKDKKDQSVTVVIDKLKGFIELDFYSDCGKFGTDEALDSYKITPERLLQILQDREDITEEEC